MLAFKLLVWVKNKIDRIRKKFLWVGPGGNRKVYNLVELEQIYMSKEEGKGGLGITNLEHMNKAYCPNGGGSWC